MDELKKRYRMTMIIGIAMIMSLFIYAVMVEIIKMHFSPFKRIDQFPGLEILRYIFFGVALIGFYLIRWIRQFILYKKIAIEKTTDQSVILSSKIQRLIRTTIITYALCEWIAIFGLILFFITGSSLDFYFFAALSLIFYAIYFQKYRQWEEYVSFRAEIEGPS